MHLIACFLYIIHIYIVILSKDQDFKLINLNLNLNICLNNLLDINLTGILILRVNIVVLFSVKMIKLHK